MKYISMGLNTEPYWLKADEVIERWEDSGAADMVDLWKRYKQKSLDLRAEIIAAIEEDGECEIGWSCMGETRFHMHACQWRDALPQFRFEIGRYSCKVFKK